MVTEDEEERRKRTALEAAWQAANNPEHKNGKDRLALRATYRHTVVGTGTGGTDFAFAFETDTFSPHRAFENAGFRTGEIIAHRAWLRNQEGLLESMGQNVIWHDRYMHGHPDEYDSGVHAFKTKDIVHMEYGDVADVVIGRVKLWGVVYEHDLGYRAEHGKMIALDSISLRVGGGWFSGVCKYKRKDPNAELRRLRAHYALPLDGSVLL